ncbi:hypothetical protein FACS1894185_2640 [Betaproteobacteria bacterium]|nr:hypothetical protein FACS1894185_2640 [Betaproteobacteria bacterium]
MSRSPYENMEQILAEIARRAEAREWSSAAQAATQLDAQMRKGLMPTPTEADRAALKAGLAHIAAINELAVPLHKDIATLLKAFGGVEAGG